MAETVKITHRHNCPNCFYFFECSEPQCATDYSKRCPECWETKSYMSMFSDTNVGDD
jgi:hypothetical protein